MIVDSGVHPSLHPKCHHQITYCRSNVTVEYPPPYEKLVWDYIKADIESIKQDFILTNWDHLFRNKDVHQQVKILTDTLFNVFSNYTPNKVVTFDDRDPPWMTEFIKFKIQQHNSTYKNYHQKISKSLDYEILQSEIENIASIHYI